MFDLDALPINFGSDTACGEVNEAGVDNTNSCIAYDNMN